MTSGLTQAQAAEVSGLGRATITRRVLAGEIPVLPDGTIDPSVAAGLERKRARSSPGSKIAAGRNGSSDLTPQQRKTLAEAEVKELVAAKMRGELVEVAALAPTWQAFARRVHDEVLLVSDEFARLAPDRPDLIAHVERLCKAALNRVADMPVLGEATDE